MHFSANTISNIGIIFDVKGARKKLGASSDSGTFIPKIDSRSKRIVARLDRDPSVSRRLSGYSEYYAQRRIMRRNDFRQLESKCCTGIPLLNKKSLQIFRRKSLHGSAPTNAVERLTDYDMKRRSFTRLRLTCLHDEMLHRMTEPVPFLSERSSRILIKRHARHGRNQETNIVSSGCMDFESTERNTVDKLDRHSSKRKEPTKEICTCQQQSKLKQPTHSKTSFSASRILGRFHPRALHYVETVLKDKNPSSYLCDGPQTKTSFFKQSATSNTHPRSLGLIQQWRHSLEVIALEQLSQVKQARQDLADCYTELANTTGALGRELARCQAECESTRARHAMMSQEMVGRLAQLKFP